MANLTQTRHIVDSDFITCAICGKKLKQISVHLKRAHNVSVEEYVTLHPNAPHYTKECYDRLSRGQQKRWNGGSPAGGSSSTGTAQPTTPTTPQPTPQPSSTGTTVTPYQFGAISLSKRRDTVDLSLVPDWDDGFHMDDEVMEALAIGIKGDDNTLLTGPTGCGKTHSVMMMASLLGQPIVRTNMTGDVRAADFVGEKIVDIDATTGESYVTFQYGPLATAMREGHWLLVDEIDAMPPQIAFVLQSILEGKDLVLKENGGEVVKRHRAFRLFATANTKGKGDDSGLYGGTTQMNEAFLDRFGVAAEHNYMPKAAEIKVLRSKHGTDAVTARKMVDVANLVREGFKQQVCEAPFSTRRLLAWAKVYKLTGDVQRAAKLSFLNKLEEDERAYVNDMMNRVF